MKTNQTARLELRLSKEQKDHFEQMAELGGFKTLTDFMVHAADKEAKKIEQRKNAILTTKKDWKVFIDAVFVNPPAPNAALKKAAKRYKKLLSEK
ncbi:MAG TPA: DUF1778 domain-containing protein [Chitinophagaceae bacterium]|nr:DUF1778 domain-containing protein [Chitinophagaceae bacterium]